MKSIAKALRAGWRGLRALMGDDAYERYLEHVRRRHPAQIPLDRNAYCRAELDRRWSRINRCC
jgi:uncharacterized short protein YbdD (DUF466 family)